MLVCCQIPSTRGHREARLLAAFDALRARVKSGRAEEGDLLRYIQLSMGDNPDEPGLGARLPTA